MASPFGDDFDEEEYDPDEDDADSGLSKRTNSPSNKVNRALSAFDDDEEDEDDAPSKSRSSVFGAGLPSRPPGAPSPSGGSGITTPSPIRSPGTPPPSGGSGVTPFQRQPLGGGSGAGPSGSGSSGGSSSGGFGSGSFGSSSNAPKPGSGLPGTSPGGGGTGGNNPPRSPGGSPFGGSTPPPAGGGFSPSGSSAPKPPTPGGSGFGGGSSPPSPGSNAPKPPTPGGSGFGGGSSPSSPGSNAPKPPTPGGSGFGGGSSPSSPGSNAPKPPTPSGSPPPSGAKPPDKPKDDAGKGGGVAGALGKFAPKLGAGKKDDDQAGGKPAAPPKDKDAGGGIAGRLTGAASGLGSRLPFGKKDDKAAAPSAGSPPTASGAPKPPTPGGSSPSSSSSPSFGSGASSGSGAPKPPTPGGSGFGGGSAPSAGAKPPASGAPPAGASAPKPAGDTGGNPLSRVGGAVAGLGAGIGSRLPFGKKDDKAAAAPPGGGKAAPVSAVGGSASPLGAAKAAPAKPDDKKAAKPAAGKAAAPANPLAALRERVTALPLFGGDTKKKPAAKAAKVGKNAKPVEYKPLSISIDKRLEILGIVMVISAIVILLSSLSPTKGALTEGITTFLSRTFGWGALGIPLAMLPIGVWLIMLRAGEETPTVDTTRVVGVVLFYLALITLFHFVHAIDLYQVGAGQDYLTVVRNVFLNISAELGRGGGVVGGEIYYLLLSNIGELGGFLVVIAVLMIALMLVTSLSVSQLGVIAISLARSFNDGRKRWAVRNAAKRAELTEKRRVALAAKAAASPVTASGPAGVAVPAGMTFAPPVAAGGAPAPVPAPSAAAPAPAFAPAMMTTTGGLPLPPTPAVSAMALPALGQPPIAEPERSILITGGGRTMTVSPTGAPVSTPPPTAAPAFAPNAPVPAAAPMVNAPAANAPTPAASTPFAPPPAGTPLAPVPSSIATPTPSTGTPFAPPSPIGGQPATLTPAATSALPPAAGSPPKDDKKPGLFGGLPFGRKDGADKAPTPALAGAGNGAPAAGSPPKTDDGKARGLPFGNPLKRGGKDDTESASAANGGQSSVPAAANAGGAAASPALAGAPSGYVSPFRAATPPTPPPVGAPTVVATPTNAPTSGVSAANTGSAPANDSKPFDPRAANVTAASGVSAANTGSAPANDSKPFDPRAANTTPASAPASGTSAANTGSEPANDSKPFDPRAANTTPASGVSAANTGSAPANDSKPFDPRAANTTPASAPTGGTSAANTGSAPANDSKPFDPRAANVTSNGASTSAPAVPTPTADTPAAQPMGVPLRPAPYQRTPLTGAVAARDDAATKTGEVVRMGAGTVPPPVSAPKKPAVFDDDEDDLDADFDLDDADALMRPAQPKGLGALPRATSTTARVMPTVPTTQTADVPKVAPSAHPPSPTVAPSGSAPAPSGVGAAARAAAGVGAALVGSALGALASGENNPSTPSQTVATPAAGNTPPARRVPPWEDEPAPMPAARTPDPVPAPMPAARTPDPIPVAAPVPAARTPDPVPTPAASANGDAEPAPNAPQVTRSKRKTYTLPDFAPLLQSGTDHELDHEKLIERARVIEETLSSFGAPGRVVEVRTGPVITQFGVEPDYLVARGGKKNRVKVSAIAALDKDLQLALGAKSIRIEAPVPGKGYVGIEVPNESPSVVRLRDVLESPEYNRIKSPLAFALGQSVDGTPVAAALDSMPHLLIAGTTGSGKSVCVNAIIGSLLIRNSPERLKLIMVDPKRVELTGYNGIPHLIAPVVVEHDRAVNVLKWVTREMDDRYRRFASAGARNLDDYNKHLPAGEEILPYIVVVIDELADLMMLSPDETERTITRIAALARATGIHLVIATQRPSVDVVTGLIKANFPARIAFAVASSTDSRVILDQPGADRLLGRGDMLYMSGDSPAPVRLQGVFVSDSEIGNVTRFWRGQVDDMDLAAARPAITAFALDEMSSKGDNKGGGKGRGGSGAVIAPWQRDQNKRPKSDDDDDFVTEDWDGDGDVDSDDDELYNQAVDMVRRLDKASVSLLQRRLRIGYTRAARLIDVMEERGVVGPAVEGSKPRDVLPPKV